MTAIGLTGGIGSGKSTVASMLLRRGATLVDADVLAKEALQPGTTAFFEVRKRFGDAVVAKDGSFDRGALARVVFSDPAARADLNAIVHPVVGAAIAERLALAAEDDIVVVDVPLLAEEGRHRHRFEGVVVVDCPVELAIERLVTLRQMDRRDAEARVAAQSSRAERLKMADFVILNTGTLDELEEMSRRAFCWARSLRQEGA